MGAKFIVIKVDKMNKQDWNDKIMIDGDRREEEDKEETIEEV
jgi:hypothetical protein